MGDEPNSSNGSMTIGEVILDAKLARCYLAQAELQASKDGFVPPLHPPATEIAVKHEAE